MQQFMMDGYYRSSSDAQAVLRESVEIELRDRSRPDGLFHNFEVD